MQNLSNQVAILSDKREATALRAVLDGVYRRLANVTHTSAGLAIKAGGGVLVKIGATACNYAINGLAAVLAAATDMAALSGTVTNAAFNVYVFSVDAAGNLYSQMGTEGATLALVKFPNVPDNRAILGYITINPTGTGNFVGGTTALDDGTVVPTAVYVNTIGALALTAPLV